MEPGREQFLLHRNNQVGQEGTALRCTRGSLDWKFGITLFNQMVFKYWNKLPRDEVVSMFLEVFQRSVDLALMDI